MASQHLRWIPILRGTKLLASSMCPTCLSSLVRRCLLKGCWLPGEKPSSIKIHWTNPGQKKLILTIQWDRGSYCELTLCRLAMLVMGIRIWTRCSPCSRELRYFPLADSHPSPPHFTIPFFSAFCNLSLYKLVSVISKNAVRQSLRLILHFNCLD